MPVLVSLFIVRCQSETTICFDHALKGGSARIAEQIEGNCSLVGMEPIGVRGGWVQNYGVLRAFELQLAVKEKRAVRIIPMVFIARQLGAGAACLP